MQQFQPPFKDTKTSDTQSYYPSGSCSGYTLLALLSTPTLQSAYLVFPSLQQNPEKPYLLNTAPEFPTSGRAIYWIAALFTFLLLLELG